jgi:mannose-1-phosphate guanylyltransferase
MRTIGVSPATDRRLRSIRAVVMLEGSVGTSAFAHAVGRSLLDLPADGQRLVLDVWRDELKGLAHYLGLARLSCRIVIGRHTHAPCLTAADRDAGLTVERDPAAIRGTGGLLRDLAQDYDGAGSLLVANAAQLLTRPLHAVVEEAASRGGDVTLVANADGTPAGVTLVSCPSLRSLPPIGFVDFKEQGLPLIAKAHRVTVRYCSQPAVLSIRTPRDYFAALRAYRRLAAGVMKMDEPFAERWQSVVALVEDGARVAPTAKLHDAVVLRGGIVDDGAVAVRSIVCSGGRVARGSPAVDELITASG